MFLLFFSSTLRSILFSICECSYINNSFPFSSSTSCSLFSADAYALSVVVADTKNESRRKSFAVINSSTRLCFLSFALPACLCPSPPRIVLSLCKRVKVFVSLPATIKSAKKKISTILSTAGVLTSMLRRG